MNVDPIHWRALRRSLPLSVRWSGDSGVYLVRSRSQAKVEWRVDVTMCQCDCPSGTVGQARQSAKANGGSPVFAAMCPHLKLALVTHAIFKIAEESGVPGNVMAGEDL